MAQKILGEQPKPRILVLVDDEDLESETVGELSIRQELETLRAADLARREKDGEKPEHGYKYRGSNDLLRPAFAALVADGFLAHDRDVTYAPDPSLMP